MIKQGTMYAEVINFINSYKIGETFTTSEFKDALYDITRKKNQHKKWNGQFYRIRSYQGYLGASGFITNVRRGLWRINYPVPDWMSLYALEMLRGYKDSGYDYKLGRYVAKDHSQKHHLQAKLAQYKRMIDKDGVLEYKQSQPKSQTATMKKNNTDLSDILVVGNVIAYEGDTPRIEYTITSISDSEIGLHWHKLNPGELWTENRATFERQCSEGCISLIRKAKPEPTEPIGWKIGDKIRITDDQPIYTIEHWTDETHTAVNLSWTEKDGQVNRQISAYEVELVNECVARPDSDPHKWKVVVEKLYAKCRRTKLHNKYKAGYYYEVLRVDEDRYPDLIINEDGGQWWLGQGPESFEKPIWAPEKPAADLPQPATKHIVKCTDKGTHSELTEGALYETEQSKSEDPDLYYRIKDDSGDYVELFKSRFTEVSDPMAGLSPVPKDRLPEFLNELEALIKKYK